MTTRAIAIGALLTVVLLLVRERSAGHVPPSQRIVVRVGEVIEVDVDRKIGYACDKPAILRAWMVTRDERNWFVVEGVEVGETWCRVGTDPNLPGYLFEVVVGPKRESAT